MGSGCPMVVCPPVSPFPKTSGPETTNSARQQPAETESHVSRKRYEIGHNCICKSCIARKNLSWPILSSAKFQTGSSRLAALSYHIVFKPTGIHPTQLGLSKQRIRHFLIHHSITQTWQDQNYWCQCEWHRRRWCCGRLRWKMIQGNTMAGVASNNRQSLKGAFTRNLSFLYILLVWPGFSKKIILNVVFYWMRWCWQSNWRNSSCSGSEHIGLKWIQNGRTKETILMFSLFLLFEKSGERLFKEVALAVVLRLTTKLPWVRSIGSIAIFHTTNILVLLIQAQHMDQC